MSFKTMLKSQKTKSFLTFISKFVQMQSTSLKLKGKGARKIPVYETTKSTLLNVLKFFLSFLFLLSYNIKQINWLHREAK